MWRVCSVVAAAYRRVFRLFTTSSTAPNTAGNIRGVISVAKYDQSRRITSTAAFIAESTRQYPGAFDYAETQYISCYLPVAIRCRKHNHVFHQISADHRKHPGCIHCRTDIVESTRLAAEQEFIAVCTKNHGGKYDYSRVKYRGTKEKVEIGCPDHGFFWQNAGKHKNVKQGCPSCRNKTEGKLHQWLLVRFPEVHAHVRFDSLRKSSSGRMFEYDFVLEFVNTTNMTATKIAIELDGDQHFRYVGRFKNIPAEQLRNDTEKAIKLCQTGSNLIRIYQPWVAQNTHEWQQKLTATIEHIIATECRGQAFYIGGAVYDGHIRASAGSRALPRSLENLNIADRVSAYARFISCK